MKHLLETVARGLCEQPDRVRVALDDAGELVRLELQVAPADRGRVIGRNGRTADALRAVLAAVARARAQRVELEIRT